MQPLPNCVYILFSEKDHQLYTGFTTNVEKRLKYHNAGWNTSTRNRGPFILVFCEYYHLKVDALNREKYLKTSAGKRTIKIMLRNTLISLGYNSKVGFE